jgi:hypothetical protein
MDSCNQCCPTFLYIGAYLTAVEARAPCGNCNTTTTNNNHKVIIIVILIKIITDGNLTLIKRLIKKNCTYIIRVKKERVGLGGTRMGKKENNISKAGRPCPWECYEKIEACCYSEIFFP